MLGIGAAAIFPLALSVLPVLFAPEERQKAVAAIAGATMLSFPIGPIVGGYLLSHFWWGSVFLINVPIVVIAVAAVALLMPESRSERRPSIDLSGLAVSTVGLVALTYGFIKAGQDGWSDATALALIAAGVVVLALLPVVERRIADRGGQPLADLQLFRSAGFRWGTILATLRVVRDVRHLLRAAPVLPGRPGRGRARQRHQAASPDRRHAGRHGGRHAPDGGKEGRSELRPARGGRRRPAYLLMAAAMALGALTTLGSSTGYVLGWVALAGLGLGLVMPSAMGVALGALSAERSGAGSALLTAMRQVGSTIGVADTRHGDQQQLRQRRGQLGGRASRRRPRRRCGQASARASGWRASSAPRRCSTRSARPSCTAWTSCCGPAAASRIACALLAVLFLPRRTRPQDAGDVTSDSVPGSLPVA